jgi:hypothetical protein
MRPDSVIVESRRKIGFVESEGSDFPPDQIGSGIPGQGGHDHLLIIDTLPDESAKQRDRGEIVVYEVAPDVY